MTIGIPVPFSIALEALSVQHRQVLTLHDVGRMSADDIGDRLGITAAQARIELRHARRAVCQRLSEPVRTAA